MNPADLFNHETDVVELAPGEVLFQQGDKGDCMFVVLGGSVEVWVSGTCVERSSRGTILGEMALIDASPRGATVRATEETRLARVDSRRFNFIIQQNPFFARHLMKVMADRIRHMNQVIAVPPGS
jgi:CRP/FNR family transcriptional regulator, cyclic AMP receptor protein